MKSFKKNTATLLISNTSIFLTTFINGIVLARFMDVELLGQYRIITTYSALVSAIATIQIPTAILYFIVHYKKKKTEFIDGAQQLTIFLSVVGSLVFGIVYAALSISKGMTDHFWFIILIYCLITFFKIIMLIYPSIYVASGKTRIIIRTSIIYSATQLLLVPLVITLTGSFALLLIADLMSTVFSVVFGGYLKLLTGTSIKIKDVSRNRVFIRIILRYSKYLAFSNAMRSIAYQIDRIVLSLLATPASYAIYSVVAIENPLNKILLNSFNTSLIPEMKTQQKAKNYAGMWNSWHQSINYSSIHLFPVMWFTLIFSEEILELLFGLNYSGYYPILSVVSMIVVIRVASYQTMLRIYGYTKYNLRSTIIAFVISLPIMAYVVSNHGLLGLAIAYLFNWLIYNSIVIYYIKRISNEKLSLIIGTKVIAKQLAITLMIFIIPYTVGNIFSFEKALYQFVFTAVLFVPLYLPYYQYQRKLF